MHLNLLTQILIAWGIWTFLLILALHLFTWWIWLLWILSTCLLFRWLRLMARFGAGVCETVAWPHPGYFYASHEILNSMLVDGWYRLVFHGQWPRRPVLYAVNYPSDGVEYLFFGIVDQYSGRPLTTVSKAPNKHLGWYSKFMNAMFQDGINHITVAEDGKSFDHVKNEIRKHVRERERSVYFYGNSTPKPYEVAPFRTGMFRIASELQIPIVPIVFSHLDKIFTSGPREIHVWIGHEHVSDNYEHLIEHCEEFQHRHLHP